MDNCIRLRCLSPFHYRFVYVDTREHISARVFNNSGLRVHRVKEMKQSGSPFRLIICSVRRRDFGKFAEALSNLYNCALLLGYRDYGDICMLLKQAEAGCSRTFYCNQNQV